MSRKRAVVCLGLATGLMALLGPRPANAWWVYGGVRPVAPPVVVVPPRVYRPPVLIVPPPVAYAPPRLVYALPPRAWIPGHWRGGVWVPAHWSR